ncbi:MAG: putative quinol monooxygenase [Paracoccaceae bacterium]
MIRLKGHLICMTAEEALTVQLHLPEHIRLSQAEPGCLSFEVSQTDDPLIWEVREAFRTRADFDAHQTRTRDSDWFNATRHILRDFWVDELRD